MPQTRINEPINMYRFTRTLGVILMLAQLSTSQHYFGVNLAGGEFGNKRSVGEYGKDYRYPAAEDLDYYKEKGLLLIRVAFRWERMQHEQFGDFDADELARFRGVVDAARTRGMLVVPDMHNYARRGVSASNKDYIVGSPEVPIDAFADFWEKFARHFNADPVIWGYGLVNEPHDMGDYSWFDAAQAAINSIRTVDTVTAIIVAGDSWSSAARWVDASGHLAKLVDPKDNLIFEAHQYFDWDASGTYKKSYDDDGANPMIGVKRVTPFIEWLKENGFRGFLGEYGVPADDERWLVALDNFLSFIDSNGVSGVYWAGGPIWGNYILSCEPKNGVEKRQMSIIEKYTGSSRNVLMHE